MPELRKVSGEKAVKILCNKLGFSISGRTGSHVRLSKETPEGKVGTVVPVHSELKIGTLKGILKCRKFLISIEICKNFRACSKIVIIHFKNSCDF